VVLTTPILEGLDGVQKMSKSLNNAIGIHEPPFEMYGKVMSVSDEIMWRYYELLTDVSMAEIERMKHESHPMQAKKDLACRVVADFYSVDVATKAGEDWAKQFQKDEIPESVEEVSLNLAEIEWSISEESGENVAGDQQLGIKLDRLLVKCGLADSATDAARKLKQGSVRIGIGDGTGDDVFHDPRVALRSVRLPFKIRLRVGKRAKVAVIHGGPVT
jgi:tyrosyl-tRNA synthetase